MTAKILDRAGRCEVPGCKKEGKYRSWLFFRSEPGQPRADPMRRMVCERHIVTGGFEDIKRAEAQQ